MLNKIKPALIIASAVLWVKPAAAVCPICTLAVGAGVGFSRWLGVDDTVVGLWVGALTGSMSIWTINWLHEKKWNFPWCSEVVTAAYYALVVLPLYFTGLTGQPLSSLAMWGIDKLLLGVVTGSLVFWSAASGYQAYKSKYGRALFPFQKVAMPVAALLLTSFLFYWLTR